MATINADAGVEQLTAITQSPPASGTGWAYAGAAAGVAAGFAADALGDDP